MAHLEPLVLATFGASWLLAVISLLGAIAVLSPHAWQRKAAREMLVFLLRRRI